MVHNVVIVEPGAAKEVGDQAFNLGLKGSQMNYIPVFKQGAISYQSYTARELQRHIYFNAPLKPGNYTILCTYPGHAMVMQATLKVVK